MNFNLAVSTRDPDRLLDALLEAMDRSHIDEWDYNEEGDMVHLNSAAHVHLRPQCEHTKLRWEVLRGAVNAAPPHAIAHSIASFISILLTRHPDDIFEIVID